MGRSSELMSRHKSRLQEVGCALALRVVCNGVESRAVKSRIVAVNGKSFYCTARLVQSCNDARFF
jgi:hypothetical protein